MTKTSKMPGLITASALALSAGLAAAPAIAQDDTAPRIAMLTGDISDFGQAQIDGLERGAAEYGGTVNVFSSGDDAQKQDSACQDIIVSGRYNVLVLNSANAIAAMACADDAAAAGLKVFAMETPIGPDPNTTDIQMDSVSGSVIFPPLQLGENQMELLLRACEDKDPCKFVLIVGIRGYHLDTYRMEAIEAALPNHPHLEMVALGEDGYDGSVGQRVANDLLRANPDADVLVASTDSTAVQVVNVLEELGMTDQVTILGEGGSRQGAEALAAGTIAGSVGAWPESMGYKVATMAGQLLAGEEIEDPDLSIYDVGEELGQPVLLSPENVADFIPEWG